MLWNIWFALTGCQSESIFSSIPEWNLPPTAIVFLSRPRNAIRNRSTCHRQRVLWRFSHSTRGQLINLMPKICNNQYTISWHFFFLEEFIRECCSNSDSNSTAHEKVGHENRPSAWQANPNTILTGCPIGLPQVKEEKNYPLLPCKGIPDTPFENHSWFMVMQRLLKSNWLLSSIPDFEVLYEAFITYLLQYLA